MIRITIWIQDPDLRSESYTDLHDNFSKGVSRANDQPINFGSDPDYDPDLGSGSDH